MHKKHQLISYEPESNPYNFKWECLDCKKRFKKQKHAKHFSCKREYQKSLSLSKFKKVRYQMDKPAPILLDCCKRYICMQEEAYAEMGKKPTSTTYYMIKGALASLQSQPEPTEFTTLLKVLEIYATTEYPASQHFYQGLCLKAKEELNWQAEQIKELKERIEFAVEYLPESPHTALGFLEPVLGGGA